MEKASLAPIQGLEIIWRGLYGINHSNNSYVIEVDYLDPKEHVWLYRNGLLADEKKSPARFQVSDDATIEVSMALYGMKQVRLITENGEKKMLTPLPGTAEEKRLRWDRSHPIASRSIAAAAWLVLVAALITQIPNTINSLVWTLSHLPCAPSLAPVPSFSLPEWLNVLLGVAGIAAGLDRGLRMLHNPLIDD